MHTDSLTTQGDEAAIRQLIEDWAQAVRNRDLPRILAHHSDNLVMYDVPKPFQSTGIDAYRSTWDTFFRYTRPGVFNIQQLTVAAADTVAFCFATMQCADKSGNGDYAALDFRLTIGLQKINGQWTIVHEHHSIPSE